MSLLCYNSAAFAVQYILFISPALFRPEVCFFVPDIFISLLLRQYKSSHAKSIIDTRMRFPVRYIYDVKADDTYNLILGLCI